jgi:hypothetical protein
MRVNDVDASQERLAILLEEKGSYISGKYPELSVEPVVRDMNAMVDGYASLLPKEERLIESSSP